MWACLKITLSPFDSRAHKIAKITVNFWKSWSLISFSNGEIFSTIHWIMLPWACRKTFLSNRQTKQANTKVNYSLSESVHIFKAIRKLWKNTRLWLLHITTLLSSKKLLMGEYLNSMCFFWWHSHIDILVWIAMVMIHSIHMIHVIIQQVPALLI